MAKRRDDDILRRKLEAWSEENLETPIFNGRHCRDWRAAGDSGGYGKMWDGERLQYTHRLAYEVWIGPIPEGMKILHGCDRGCCIEVAHLMVGTQAENMADKAIRGRARNGAEFRRGELAPNATLTNDQAAGIKALRNNVTVTAERVARRFLTNEATVRAIWSGRAWKWLEVEDDLTPQPGPPRGYRAAKVVPIRKYALNEPGRPRFVGKSLKEALRG